MERYLPSRHQQQIQDALLGLLRKMANNQLYCLDLKTLNIVVREAPTPDQPYRLQVRFIDFDTEWCFRRFLPSMTSLPKVDGRTISKKRYIRLMNDFLLILLSAVLEEYNPRLNVLRPVVERHSQRFQEERELLQLLFRDNDVQTITDSYLQTHDMNTILRVAGVREASLHR